MGSSHLSTSPPFNVTLKWSMSLPLALAWTMTSVPAFPGRLLAMAVAYSSIENTSQRPGELYGDTCTGVSSSKICARLASWGAGLCGVSEQIIRRINVAVFSWIFCMTVTIT
jgi:hypothetical protein